MGIKRYLVELVPGAPELHEVVLAAEHEAELARLNPAAAQVQAELPPFARKVIEKLKRVDACFSDSQGADIGRHWLDLLTQLGLLNRVQRSPAAWEITSQGEDALTAAPVPPVQQAEQVPVDFELPEYHEQGMGCGLEDRGITDRYEACRYGFEQAAEQFADILAGYGALYTDPPAAPAQDVAGLVEALEAILPFIPNTSASEGGAAQYSDNVRAADKVRAALAAYKDAPAQQPAAVDGMSTAARGVLAERKRQVEVEGRSPASDDSYSGCELAAAAATYALCTHLDQLKVCGVTAWPWPDHWWKPTTYRRNLTKSGALILAEIERIDRAALAGGAQ